MQPSEYFKQRCAHCSNNFEFPASGIGECIDCPHCGSPTILQSLEQPAARAAKEQFALRSPPRIILLAVIGFTVMALAGSYFWHLHAERIAASERAGLLHAKNITRQQIRAEAVGLALGIEKGMSQAEFEAMSRQLLLLSRLHSNNLTGGELREFKQVEASIDACSYFWSRVNESDNEGKCIRATETDKAWLAKAGLGDQDAIWRTYDFKAASQRIQAQLPAMLDYYSHASHSLSAKRLANARFSATGSR